MRNVVIVILILPALLSGCSGENIDNEQSVVLYVSADDYVARQIVQRFEKKTGIRVDVVGDTEATKTTGLANRIRAEKNHPKGDVFWSSECFMMIQLADEGLLVPHLSVATESWPMQFRDSERLWYGFAMRARVIVYSTERVKEEDIPRKWSDLTDKKWKGRIAMADPRFGTTRGHMGAMKAYWTPGFPGFSNDPSPYETFLKGLLANGVRDLTSGNAGVVRSVISGEADIGLTDTDDVWAAQRNGAKVNLVYPYHGDTGKAGEGTLVIPNTVALIKGGKNTEAARKLIDFILSEEVERILVESDSHNIPIRESIAAEYPKYTVPDPLDIDLKEAAANMDSAVRTASLILNGSDG